MPNVTLMGAGSGFTLPLFRDLMQIPDIDGGTLGLVDVDAYRLGLSERLIREVARRLGQEKKWQVKASTNRRRVLPGTDYLINCIEVSGVQTVRYDYRIPKKYGVDQCIGDTIGPGGLMKALRTIPSWLEIVRDAEELCPRAHILNYTNPMSMMSLATICSTEMPYLGLCHSVQGASHQLAHYVGVPYDEMEWRCGGINHMAWFTVLRHKGKDLYPVLRRKLERKAKLGSARLYDHDRVRFDLMQHFGYFVTESSGHMSEYVPYYRKREKLIDRYCGEGYSGGRGFYARMWPGGRKAGDRWREAMIAGKKEIALDRGHEFASYIIEAHQMNRAAVIHASVDNTGLIENLPREGVVEVAVVVDKMGFHPCHFGVLPPQVAALCAANMASFELGVKSVLEEDREAAVHSLLLDPLTAAVCSPAEIKKMFEELVRAEKPFLPKYITKGIRKK